MESKRHLIALDLDGTLLTNKKDVSTFTRNVLQQARRLGHIVVIATGRSHLMSNYYYDLLDLNTPMINYNGSYIHHPKDQAWDRRVHHPVPIKIALKIVDACYELGVQNLWVESGNQIILNNHDPQIIQAFQRLHRSGDELPLAIGSVKKHMTEDPTALIIYPEEKSIVSLREALTDHFSEKVH